MAQRYIKFFGGAWRSDPGLRLCSAATRGVWIDCISLMIEAEPHGYLASEGKPMTADDIAGLTNTPVKVVKTALAELRQRRVCDVTDEGVVYSRRMVRDKAKQEEARANGRTGGNPTLKPKPTGAITPGVNPQHNSEDKLTSREPSAISHQPSELASASSGPPQGWRALIEAFDAAIVSTYGPSRARAWPSPNDQLDAKRMSELGVTPAGVLEVATRVCNRLLAQGKEPPAVLAYVRAACLDALEKQPRAAPNLTRAEDMRLAHLLGWLACGIWQGDGQAPTDRAAAQAEADRLRAKRDGKEAA